MIMLVYNFQMIIMLTIVITSIFYYEILTFARFIDKNEVINFSITAFIKIVKIQFF